MATIEDDYAVVRELLGAVVAHDAGLEISPSAQETIDAVARLTGTAAAQTGRTALEVGKVLNLDKSSAWRRLKAAAADGHLANLETRDGQPGRYVVSGGHARGDAAPADRRGAAAGIYLPLARPQNRATVQPEPKRRTGPRT